MKKRLLSAALVICLLASFGGCSGKQEQTLLPTELMEGSGQIGQIEAPQITEAADHHEGEAKSFLTGEWIPAETAGKRPVAMMVENTHATLPQYGLNRADIIVECPVEGGITRLLAVFQDYSGMGIIGNVRSCRPYYVPFANDFDAVYLHAGASPEGSDLLNSGAVDHIDGTSGTGGAFYYRDNSRRAPHNLYTSSEGIDQGIEAFGFEREHDASYAGNLRFADDEEPVLLLNGMDAAAVSLYYRDARPWFEYHEDDGLYYRYEFGAAQIDGTDQSQLAVKNIILQECGSSFYDMEAGTLNLDCYSGGNGKYLTNGKCIDIVWRRDSRNSAVRYYDLSGNEITLNQGKTWIEVIQSQNAGENNIYGTIEEFESGR